MSAIDERFADLGVQVPDVLIPGSAIDPYKWAVIACDQHTSEPEYWEKVAEQVGDDPSTLSLIFPEVYLEDGDEEDRIALINRSMQEYIDKDVVTSAGHCMILTRRRTPHAEDRRGLILALDLERYDYRPGAKSLIRATEETIEARLPPRVRIRKDAALELPHILVLIDDPDDALFSGLAGRSLERLYSTDLMLNGGSLQGFRVDQTHLEFVAERLEAIRDASTSNEPFLFAMGDGNHSLATAKAVWEEQKRHGEPNALSRYALVEVINTYDPGLTFEPIHRLIEGPGLRAAMDELAVAVSGEQQSCAGDELEGLVARGNGIGVADARGASVVSVPTGTLPVAAVQQYLNDRDDITVDYIHGWETAVRLGERPGAAAVLMPPFDRSMLYPYIEEHGVLPRKAFSLGEAEEKRYYFEARRIS